MKIHHINCATLCPLLGKSLVHRSGNLVCHCLLVEGTDGLVLVDTGIGIEDVRSVRERMGIPFMTFARPRLDENECAARHVTQLGFSPTDVKHVVVTHLDLDHAGGIPDFPGAEIHVMEAEWDAALRPQSPFEAHRYRPCHWAHGPRWRLHRAEGERWFGFESVRALDNSKSDILLVPLEGHTRGHAAVAIQTDEGWLLHAGDAYFCHDEMDADDPRCTPALATFQTLVAIDNAKRRSNQVRLRELIHRTDSRVQFFCAHDPTEFEHFSG